MSRYQCWNCLTHHSGDYEQCNECTSKGRDKPTMWRPGPNYVPPSNADCLRATSDEELAEFLSDFKDCAGDCLVGRGVKDCSGICATRETLKMWLQQPAEEDE